MTTKEVAEKTGLSLSRVQKASPAFAKKVGRDWVWDEKGVKKLLERKGKRGRPEGWRKSFT